MMLPQIFYRRPLPIQSSPEGQAATFVNVTPMDVLKEISGKLPAVFVGTKKQIC